MVFPFAKWLRFDLTKERVDRYAARQPHRLLAGVHVSLEQGNIDAALAIVSGRNKFLAVKHVEHHSERLPEVLCRECRRLLTDAPISRSDRVAAEKDLTDHLALAVEALKRRAGRFVDRILAVSVLDSPAAELGSSAGPRSGPCWDSVRLAELTGMNVIDGFPDRDREAGGRGFPLGAWPLWLLLADRQGNVAQSNTVAVIVDDWLETFLLPASDGIEESPPEFRWDGLWLGDQLPRVLAELGHVIPKSFQDWGSQMAEGRAQQEWVDWWRDRRSDNQPGRSADLIRSYVVFLAQRVAHAIAGFKQAAALPLSRLIVAGASPLAPLVLNELQQVTSAWQPPPAVCTPRQLGLQDRAILPTVAALLGGLFIDQLPANCPMFTGASGLRCLGSVTPGKPARWRDLLTAMSEQAPATMKLRDAV